MKLPLLPAFILFFWLANPKAQAAPIIKCILQNLENKSKPVMTAQTSLEHLNDITKQAKRSKSMLGQQNVLLSQNSPKLTNSDNACLPVASVNALQALRKEAGLPLLNQLENQVHRLHQKFPETIKAHSTKKIGETINYLATEMLEGKKFKVKVKGLGPEGLKFNEYLTTQKNFDLIDLIEPSTEVSQGLKILQCAEVNAKGEVVDAHALVVKSIDLSGDRAVMLVSDPNRPEVDTKFYLENYQFQGHHTLKLIDPKAKSKKANTHFIASITSVGLE